MRLARSITFPPRFNLNCETVAIITPFRYFNRQARPISSSETRFPIHDARHPGLARFTQGLAYTASRCWRSRLIATSFASDLTPAIFIRASPRKAAIATSPVTGLSRWKVVPVTEAASDVNHPIGLRSS